MKVSVALCTYNGGQYLNEQLNSILSQTVEVDEVVICDDGSNDKTIEILFSYQEKHPGIFKIYQNETNLGFIKNFEKAIKLCSHEIIIICDQDDIWEKDKVEETIRFFENNSHFDGVFHDLKLIDDDKIHPSYLNWKGISHEEIIREIKNDNLFVVLVQKGSFVLGCALAVKKESLKKYEMEDFPIAHDYYIAQKLASKNTLGFISKPLSSYRLHSNQVYGLRYKSDKKEEKISETQKYFKEYVWSYLQILKRYKEMNPKENEKQTKIYSVFIKNRNSYLMSLGFLEKKIYILKCIRHKYLDLGIADLFKI
ncbi:glycosyltransferase [Chryseobacterium oranimense]|uniref:glycosyltransferase n=1 Tax=Chryseobacterium oranimense TaxID=421058 RepID=UPI0031D45F4A